MSTVTFELPDGIPAIQIDRFAADLAHQHGCTVTRNGLLYAFERRYVLDSNVRPLFRRTRSMLHPNSPEAA